MVKKKWHFQFAISNNKSDYRAIVRYYRLLSKSPFFPHGTSVYWIFGFYMKDVGSNLKISYRLISLFLTFKRNSILGRYVCMLPGVDAVEGRGWGVDGHGCRWVCPAVEWLLVLGHRICTFQKWTDWRRRTAFDLTQSEPRNSFEWDKTRPSMQFCHRQSVATF